MSDGWSSRGYLPHLDAGQVPVFLTWRTADSLPRDAYEAIRQEVLLTPEPKRRAALQSRCEKYLDEGHGECLLRHPSLARIVQTTILSGHGSSYDLDAFVIMPNHVHVVLTPRPNQKLAAIVRRLKGLSSLNVQRAVEREGRFWQPDYFDRCVRDEAHFCRVVRYIEWNPVKARLVSVPWHYRFSSAHPANADRIAVLTP